MVSVRSKPQLAAAGEQMEGSNQESCMLPRNGRRVCLFPLPFHGHINPMLQLGSILYNKGFSITVIHTHLRSPNSSNYPHFDFHSFPDGLSEAEASNPDLAALLLTLNSKCKTPFRDCLAKLMGSSSDAGERDSFACLIPDGVWPFAHSVANDAKLPTIVLQTTSISAFLAFTSYPLLHEKGYLPLQDSLLEEAVREFPPLRVKDIPIFATKVENVDELVSGMLSLLKASSGVIWNSCHELEQASLATIQKQYFPIPMYPIGPFHKYFPDSSNILHSHHHSSISWLDKQAPKSVIYVSFGTVASITEAQFLEIAWGIANSRTPFLWVVRPGLIIGAEWLEPLPERFLELVGGRGHLVKWAPQKQVLAHPAVGAFLTHNGWNSTLESTCEGVPMICQPCFGDQIVNARYASHAWRVGLHLEGKLERGEIERAIRRVLMEAEGQELRERITNVKERVAISQRQGGSSFQSLETLIHLILSF